MAKKDNTKTGRVLVHLLAAGQGFEAAFPGPKDFVSDSLFKTHADFKNMVYHLRRKGWVEITEKNGERVIKLTKKGELEALLSKARAPHHGRWDGKWRVAIFDFPQSLSSRRDMLRRLLKKNGFETLQNSVLVSPFPLNREAMAFLRESGLMDYVRFMKVEEIDGDAELRRKFKLPAYV